MYRTFRAEILVVYSDMLVLYVTHPIVISIEFRLALCVFNRTFTSDLFGYSRTTMNVASFNGRNRASSTERKERPKIIISQYKIIIDLVSYSSYLNFTL